MAQWINIMQEGCRFLAWSLLQMSQEYITDASIHYCFHDISVCNNRKDTRKAESEAKTDTLMFQNHQYIIVTHHKNKINSPIWHLCFFAYLLSLWKKLQKTCFYVFLVQSCQTLSQKTKVIENEIKLSSFSAIFSTITWVSLSWFSCDESQSYTYCFYFFHFRDVEL
jgi:hypothetical protein